MAGMPCGNAARRSFSYSRNAEYHFAIVSDVIVSGLPGVGSLTTVAGLATCSAVATVPVAGTAACSCACQAATTGYIYASAPVEETESPDAFRVSGRGELHLSVLIENMRRQGYEFQVSKPEVLFHTDENGAKLEPVEKMVCDVPSEYAGAVIEKIGRRRGVMENMTGTDRVRLEFTVPSRGLFGYRSEFMTDTRGEGVMSAVFDHYEPYKGDIPHRNVGALVSTETGEAVMYGLFYAQERGTLFCGPNTAVYTGMIVGQNARQGDIDVNVCRQKHLTSIRNAAGAETAMKLVSMRTLSLEECLEFIDDDELLEVTPKSLRMRKRVLETELRKKLAARARKGE